MTSRITYTLIRWRHQFLAFRIRRRKYYQFLVTLLLLAGIGGILAAYYGYSHRANNRLDPELGVLVQTYSAEGEIVSIDGSRLRSKFSRVETQDGRNTIVYDEKTVRTSRDTQYFLLSASAGKHQLQPTTEAELAVGNRILIYTQQNPKTSDELRAERIDILKP